MDSEALDRIATLIARRAGIQSREEDRNTLRQAVAGRMKALKLSHPNEYYLLLNSSGAEKEFERLLSLLMVGESYFFRDEGQFAALRDHTLPDIMRRRNNVKAIRIWSAGCATGEEPYSLAILMRETFGELPDWRVSVIGSDLNPDFLAKAEKGLYRRWSFRAMPEPLRQRYFTQRGEQFQLHDSIRRMVTFVQNDLYNGGYPDTARGLYGMDLILCRNVFIYYQPAAVELILGKLTATLAPDGYLLTAHSEISFIPAPGLVAKPLPDTVIYQRAASGESEPEAPAMPQRAVPREHKAVIRAPAPPAKTPSPTPDPAPLDEARRLYKKAAYRRTVKLIEPHVPSRPTGQDVPMLLLLASAHANMGELDRAGHYLKLAQKAAPLTAEPHFIAAHVAMEQGDFITAKERLKKAIYLDQDFVPAYLSLADIYSAGNDSKRARKMREAALRALEKLSPDSIVSGFDGITAVELIRIINESAPSP